MFGKNDNRLKCSFCGKNQDQVKKLIAGPGVYICDECVGLCNEILDEEKINETKTLPSGFLSGMAGLRKGRENHLDSPPSAGPDEEHKVHLETAITPLEKLLEYYEKIGPDNAATEDSEDSAKSKDRYTADDQDEDLYRALITLKTRLLGGDHSDLVPLIDKLSSIYSNRGFYHNSGNLHEWMLSIIEEKENLLSKDLEELKKELLKIYIKSGQTEKADALVDELLKNEEPEK